MHLIACSPRDRRTTAGPIDEGPAKGPTGRRNTVAGPNAPANGYPRERLLTRRYTADRIDFVRLPRADAAM